jgi:hypothetical protein
VVFGLDGNPLQSVLAKFGAALDCLVAETCRLFQRQTLTSTEAIYDFTQNRADRVGNLVPSYRRAAEARRLTLFPIPPSSFSIARK